MTQRHIVVAIEPHEDEVHCNGCALFFRGGDPCPWRRYDEYQGFTRGPLCLAAEAKLTALIDAGEAMASGPMNPFEDAWDRAVAEVKK